MSMNVTMALRAVPFFASWVVMMVAMMMPIAAPMILAFHSAPTSTRHPDDAFVSTWAFAMAYLLVWAVSGIAAYAGVLAAAAVRPALGPATADEIGGLTLMVAGIYQLTPVKQRCLSECRTPIIMTSWHDEAAGALRMGLLHGVYCLGCCWLLFVALFPLGMTIEAMAAVTLIILGEKTLPRPEFVSYGAAAVLVLCGLLMAVAPELPAVLRIFGGLTEDQGLGLGLILGITALFIAANAARPKTLDHPTCKLRRLSFLRAPSVCDPMRRGRPASRPRDWRRRRTVAALPFVKFEAPEPRRFAQRVGNGLVDPSDIPPFKEDVVAFRIFGVGIALRISIEAPIGRAPRN
jgi:predicted metal-binding membrane protein